MRPRSLEALLPLGDARGGARGGGRGVARVDDREVVQPHSEEAGGQALASVRLQPSFGCLWFLVDLLHSALVPAHITTHINTRHGFP
jgi:hypothetical protein